MTVKKAVKSRELPYVVIRADRAGAFAGYLAAEAGNTVEIVECRRLWYWKGAASLSQLAVDGVSAPASCKFPVAISRMKILGVIEIIPATEKSRLSIEAVPLWTAQ